MFSIFVAAAGHDVQGIAIVVAAHGLDATPVPVPIPVVAPVANRQGVPVVVSVAGMDVEI